MTSVDYLAGERHDANGVGWYWAPEQGFVGFAPAGNNIGCTVPGEQKQLCWRTAGWPDSTMSYGARCGGKLGFTNAEAMDWERLIFEAD